MQIATVHVQPMTCSEVHHQTCAAVVIALKLTDVDVGHYVP